MTPEQTAPLAAKPAGGSLHTSSAFIDLPEPDRRALVAMLEEEPKPLRDFRLGEQFEHRGRVFTVRDRGPYRIAIEGRCARCDFPFIASGSPGHLLKRLSTRCEHCRPGPKGGRKKWTIVDPGHELSRRKEVPGDRNYSPGDFIVRQGHGYLIRRRSEFIHKRTGRTLQGFEAIGLCSTCRAPFLFTATASQLDKQYLFRRCELHRAAGQRAQPVKWTHNAARGAWERF